MSDSPARAEAISKPLLAQMLLSPGLALGLVLVGWGLDAPAGYFAHPARAAFFAVAVLIAILVLVLAPDIELCRKGRRPVGRQRWLLAGLIVAAIFLIWFVAYADRRSLLTFGDGDALRYLGLLLYAGGNAVALVAVRTLGKQYSGYVTIQDDHQLVQTGIYALIRHPIYLRALLVAVGWPLIFRSWLVFLLVPLLTLFVAVRIRQEEKLLAEHFGAEFEAYRRRTCRLVPYLY